MCQACCSTMHIHYLIKYYYHPYFTSKENIYGLQEFRNLSQIAQLVKTGQEVFALIYFFKTN